MRRLLELALLVVLFSPTATLAEVIIACHPSCAACSGEAANQCTSCRPGDYLTGNPGTCTPCGAIENCAEVTCSTGSNSVCSECDVGFYLDGNECKACVGDIGNCDTLSCTGPDDAQCAHCNTEYFPDQGGSVCTACTDIPDCANQAVSCSSTTNSQCAFCLPGHYRDDSGEADTCPACTHVPHCTGFEDCTTADDTTCNFCEQGYYPVNNVCEPCTIDHCVGLVFCENSPSNAQCASCETGYYLVDGDSDTTPDTCAPCQPVANCAIPSCTDDTGSQCDTCADGFYLNGGACSACTPVTDCTSPITCHGTADSQCTTCAPGHDLVEGTADTCVSSTIDVPIAGNRVRISDLPNKREAKIASYDTAIEGSTVDPTVSGATLRIFSATANSAYELALPAAQWRSAGEGRFRFRSSGNPRVAVSLVGGRLLRVMLRGTGAYPLGTSQVEVGVSLTIGTTRFCTKFGGTIATDDGTRFIARRAGRPTPCPADPAP